MNLIEAIKSGKPFDGEASEDKGMVLWQDGPTGEAYLAKSGNFGDRRRLKVTDLCTNWEIQEPAATITRTQFWDAAQEAGLIDGHGTLLVTYRGDPKIPQALARLAIKLGLGD